MLLLTKANRKALPKLYAQSTKGDAAVAHVKFFTPDSNWTWYVTEFDGEDRFFGLVVGHFTELGYFTLSEILKVRGQLGLPVERDRFFEPTTIGEIRASLG